MNCTHTQEVLSQWIDGELLIAHESELFAHLNYCEGCQVFLKNLLMLNRKIFSVQSLQVPASLDQRMISVTSSAKPPMSRIPRLRPERMYSFRTVSLSVLVSIILTVFVSSFWYRYLHSQPQQTIVCLSPLPEVEVTGYVVVGHLPSKGNNR